MNENIESAIKEVAESVFYHFTDQFKKERLQSALTKFTQTILPIKEEESQDDIWVDAINISRKRYPLAELKSKFHITRKQ